MGALIAFTVILGLLVAIAAPLEYAARRSPAFEAWLERLVEALF